MLQVAAVGFAGQDGLAHVFSARQKGAASDRGRGLRYSLSSLVHNVRIRRV
ncbi:hypothetical protein SMGES_36520 [Serratia marcescens]|nr:hypothetical protein SMGES_36520 [Serratia marcescens]